MFGRTNGKNRRDGDYGSGSSKNKITSLIGPGIACEGTLTGESGIRIDGTFSGKINITGPLVVTETGRVVAEEIRASVVSVAGLVRGDITAGQVEVLAGGRIWGDVTTGAFAAEDGAFVRGKVKMLEEAPRAA